MMKQIYTCVKRCFIFFMLCFISSIVHASDITEINELSYQPSKDWEFFADDKEEIIQVNRPLNDATIKFYNVDKNEDIKTSMNDETPQIHLNDNITVDPDWQNAADSVTASEEEYARANSGYADIWKLNTDSYKNAINSNFRSQSAVDANQDPVLNFQKSIPSKYNFVMRQTDRIKVAIPESQHKDNIISVQYQSYTYQNQKLLDVIFKPNTNNSNIEFYLFNVGQIVENSQYKDVHAKVTLNVASNSTGAVQLTFYDIANKNSPEYFLRLLKNYSNPATFSAPVTIRYDFYTAKKLKDWDELYTDEKDKSKHTIDNVPSSVDKELEELKKYYTYKDITAIAELEPVEVQGYWLFSRLYKTFYISSIGVESDPGKKPFEFTQLYANGPDQNSTTVLFDENGVTNSNVLQITGEGTYDPTSISIKDQLVMTYEGNNFGYSYAGYFDKFEKQGTLGVEYSSKIPNKIEFSAPKWIETNYKEVSDDDWEKLSYSFIQNIPYNSGTDIEEMTWTIPDPQLPKGPFKLEKWEIYDEKGFDVTNKFDVTKNGETNSTTISIKPSTEFYNHNYTFSRKLTLKDKKEDKEDIEFSKMSKQNGKYVVESPEDPIEFSIQYKDKSKTLIKSNLKPKIFDMNIQSTLKIQCVEKAESPTSIHSDQCKAEAKEYFLLDEIKKEDIDIQQILATNNGEQYYTFESNEPKIPFVIKSTKQTLTLYYKKLEPGQIKIVVPETLEFEPIQLPLKPNNKKVTSERKDDNWQVKITHIPENQEYIVSVEQDEPFSYVDPVSGDNYELSIENARVIFPSSNEPTNDYCQVTEETPCTIVRLHREDFSGEKNDGFYQTEWEKGSGLLFQYTDTDKSTRPKSNKPYTSTLIFTLNSAL